MFRNPETRNYGFNLLVRQYQERVYRHIRRMVIDHEDTDDLVQDTFIKVWKNLDSFRMDSGLFTWIYRIATNETLSFIKQRSRLRALPLSGFFFKTAANISDNAGLSGTEIEVAFQKAILQLPDKQRIVFNMKYFDDLKYEEISEILGTSVGALKASYHHAVKKIEQNINAG